MELVPYRLLTKAQRRQVDISIEVKRWYVFTVRKIPKEQLLFWVQSRKRLALREPETRDASPLHELRLLRIPRGVKDRETGLGLLQQAVRKLADDVFDCKQAILVLFDWLKRTAQKQSPTRV